MARRDGAHTSAASARVEVLRARFIDAERELTMESADIVPEGWLTSATWAALLGRTVNVNQRLNQLVRDGAAETRKFRIPVGSGRTVRPVNHYRIAEKTRTRGNGR